MSLRFTMALLLSICCLATPVVVSAEVHTLTAAHTYILGDYDSKDDARQRCLLETKRKILEQAGVYIESASEVKDFQLTKDKITTFAAAVMQVKDTKEEVGFQQGHMSLTLTLKADVDLAEVRKQLATRQVDKGVRDEVAVQKERLKRLEAQLEAMQQERQNRQTPGQVSGQPPAQAPASPPSDITAADLHELKTKADLDDATAQTELGMRYVLGKGVPQDYAMARQWYEKAAVQGHAWAQSNLGSLYAEGAGAPTDYRKALEWYEKAAAQGDSNAQFKLGALYFFGQGVPVDIATARQWYAKSAAQGNAVAQVNLGALYDFGLGVPQNDMRAYMWYSLAAQRSTDASDTYAADRRDNIARRMTPAQIAEAQRLAQQCQAQQFKGC